MIKKIYYGTTKKGKFLPDDPMGFKFAFCQLEGQDTEVTVGKKQKLGSDKQRGYYRGVIVPLMAETIGEYDEDEVHEMLKWEFLRVKKDGLPDTCRSTEVLTTVEKEEYHSKIRHWAVEFHNCYIPLPNEVDY